MSLMPYASDPPGLYDCIQRSAAYGIPVYVTETGFPTFDHDHMQTVLDRYLKEVSLHVLTIAPLLMVTECFQCPSQGSCWHVDVSSGRFQANSTDLLAARRATGIYGVVVLLTSFLSVSPTFRFGI